jgi:small conductance mechanosensitive channel
LTALFVVITVASIGVFGVILSRLLASLATRAGASRSVASSVKQWVAVLMFVFAVVAVAGITGVSSAFTTLTISGIAGLAVSLALQNTLSNVIAGVLMLQDRVIRIGDEIQFGSVSGEVVKLNMRSTWVRNKDGYIAVIGNSNLAAGPIVNFTAKARLAKKLQV